MSGSRAEVTKFFVGVQLSGHIPGTLLWGELLWGGASHCPERPLPLLLSKDLWAAHLPLSSQVQGRLLLLLSFIVFPLLWCEGQEAGRSWAEQGF